MKKILFLVFVSFMWTVALMAEPVTPSQAREKARQFLNKRVASHARRSAPAATDIKMMAVGKDDSYYIFNVGEDAGFVVVSGEDATEDILGYSDTGSINPDSIPCGMRMLFDNYVEQIKFLRDNDITREQIVHPKKDRQAFHLDTSQLARFGQHDPYNDECPEYWLGIGHCVTGCIATAMAQLMYAHKWPNNTLNPISAYKSERHSYQINAIEAGTVIDWDNILQRYNDGRDVNKENKKAIANLMKYCGASVRMDYDREESLTYDHSAAYALKQIFGYSDDLKVVAYTNDSPSSWTELMCQELQKGYPIIYTGVDKDGNGHAFLLEGYDENDFFDINYGWERSGTSDDEYICHLRLFVIDGKENETIKFNNRMSAIVYVSPRTDGVTPNIPICLTPGQSKSVGKSLYWHSTETNSYENVTLLWQLNNTQPVDQSLFDLGIEIENQKGELLNDVIPAGSVDIPFSTEGTDKSITFNVSDALDNDYYTMRLVSKASGTSEWIRSDIYNKTGIGFCICNGFMAVQSTEEDQSKLTVNSLEITPTLRRVGNVVNISFSINNAGDDYDGALLAILKSTDKLSEEKYDVLNITDAALKANHTMFLSFTWVPTVEGEQEIIFYNKRFEEITRQRVYVVSDNEPLEVTDLTLKNGSLNKGFIDGTILSGSLYIKNNDIETIEEDIIIGLEDVESPEENKTKTISVSIDPNRTEGYDFRFFNQIAGHHYVITVSHASGEEFYRSPELLCKTGKEPETYPSMYSEYQVLNVPYIKTNMAAFKTNLRVAGDRIWTVINQYQSHGIVAKKADLVGHSMGGVLSRLHVQYVMGGTENVHKVITVNTPHSGSPIGDIMESVASGIEGYTNEQVDKINRWQSYKNIFDEFWGLDSRYEDIDKIDMQAVGDLGVNSDATDNYLNNPAVLDKMNDIPIHAIVTDDVITTSDLDYLSDMESYLSNEEKGWLKMIKIAAKVGLADFLWNDNTDWVVSVQSQKGGLESPFFSPVHDQWHVGSPNNKDVQNTLIGLLQESVASERFCKTGFRPDNINLINKQHNSQAYFASTKRLVSATGVEPTLTASVNSNMLTASIAGAESYDYQLMLVQFGKEAYSMVSGSQIECEVPASFSGDATIYGIVRMEEEDVMWSKTQVNIPTPRASRVSISASALSLYYDEGQPVNLTCTWSDGSETCVLPDVISFTDNLAHYENGYITGLHAGSGTATFTYQGLTCEAPFTVYNFGKKDDEESSKSVCSTITLKLSQTMTMTRQAFRGTLTMFNGNEAMSMKDVKLALKVTNVATGEEASSHEFQINAESIDGFTGEIDMASGWTLAGNRTGTATILFIPTKYAAPTEPVEWSFGGTLSYLDPFTGRVVTRDLYPVTLTVKPSPELDLTYFMQRDIYGDDPLTEAVEPMVPAEFSLLINNIGNGDATNVRMMTNQPQIIENEKGLAINFELLSSQLNGGDKTLALGGSVATDFGTIPAHTQSYAQWWLQSSLLGHFTEYDVKTTHVTSYGNPDLSLLNDVSIHELIRSIKVGNGNVTGFVANDIPDTEDTPDIVYFTDGTTADVIVAANAEWQKQSSTEYMLTIMPSKTGWNYGHVTDPTIGRAKLISIHRQSDDKEINLRNFWQTDRTLRDGKDWLYENRLHFVDEFKTVAPVTYLLTFDPVPVEELEVESFAGLPEDGTVLTKQLNELTVKFNKAIKAESFTAEDITINCQGIRQDASQIVIEKLNEQEYKLKLNEATLGDGYYVLTIQTTGIEDIEGFNGSTGKQAAWIQFVDGKVALIVNVSPVEGGTVIPGNGRFDYDSDIMLQATPAEGYEFVKWMYGEESISNNPEFMYHLYSNSELTALFSKKHYSVEICYDSTQGLVEGASSGIYDYGTQLQLVAVPKDGYGFDAWTIDAERDNQTNPYVLVVNRNMIINALFKEEDTGIHHIDSDELKVLISPLPLRDVMYIAGNFQVVRNLSIYNMNGVKVLARDNIQSNQAIDVGKFNAGIYLVQVVTDRGIYRTKILKR